MSQNRSHLVPTIVTNKNGVQTTVYRKASTGTLSATRLPKATLPTNGKSRKQLERTTAEALVNLDFGPPLNELDTANRRRDHQRLMGVLSDYGNESLQRFIEIANTDLGWELYNILCESQRNEDYLNDWLTIKSVKDTTVNNEHLINGLDSYELLPPQHKGHYPAKRTAAVTAIVRVSAHLGATGNGLVFDVTPQQEIMIHIEDEQLRDLLTTHENPDAIANIIVTRNLTDADQITALYETMNSTANAISSGTL